MRLLPLYFIGMVQRYHALSISTAAAALLVPALGDESCDASYTEASGENVCAPKAEGTHETIDADATTISAGEEGRPVWWTYDIDQLFEDYFDCGEIIYGYENADVDDDNFDDDNDDDDVEGSQKQKSKAVEENPDVISDAQLQKLRHQWAVMREKYVKELNLVPVEIHEVESTEVDEEMKVTNRGVSAIVAPCRIGDAGPHKGRGVYATEPIKEGDLVVSLDNGSTAIFKEGHSWREFAVSLPRETACNFIEWSWVQKIPPEDETDDDIRNGLTIFVSFDESNLLNAADWDGVEANIRCGTPPKREGGERGPCRFHYYAARDIAAGEELLINYGEFEELSQQGWVDIGL